MNLNFIQDNNQVHVQTQNIIASKQQIILKQKLLNQDFIDYGQINNGLVKINISLSEIVKDLYQHVTNLKEREIELSQKNISVNLLKDHHHVDLIKKKKKISIPYCTMKKLQFLKQKFLQCKKIIQIQNDFYRKFNINSQNEKRSLMKFYKLILTSYENQRQYYKKQTLKLQDRVQSVETEVKKVQKNENHPFTDFQSKILQIEQIFKYDKKLAAFEKVKNELNLLKQTRKRIYDKIKIQEEPNVKSKKSIRQRQKIAYAKNYLKSIVETERKINVLKINKNQMLERQVSQLSDKVGRLKVTNQQLKKAILQGNSEKFLLELQQKLATKSYQSKRMDSSKITKTDYIIYLKELNSKVKDHFKNKEIVFRYRLINDGVQLPKSKSVNLFVM